MKKALMIASILFVAVISTACINNIAVQELNNKAAEYMEKGDYESAINRLQASLDLDSSIYQTYYNLGVASINANKYEQAIEALESGIKINPDFNDFYYSLGVAQIGLADEIYEKSTEEDKEEDVQENKQNADKNNEITDEDKIKVRELKKKASENLTKYLKSASDAKDKESAQEMIKQCEEFLTNEEKKEY